MRKILLFAAMVMAAVTVSAAALQQEQISLSEKMIRLHVVANSDEAEDQQMKLCVRDAVLEVADRLLEQTDDPHRTLSDNIDVLAEAAEQCLRANGSAHPAKVTLEKERFPTRVYETFSLPAGVYTALRVTIGDGEGQNWWCVVFPSICMRAAGEMESVAVSAGFSKKEIWLITEENSGYVLKFRIIELLQDLQKRIGRKK